ncbi:Rid family hydrolase [Tunturiibacter psychrotolerans]|jgi:2-iminobutanoate/2-iminopropanoate deaminase|uniref:RidA family protein n=1 Tax=Tunturiibacter psychrotolerans TaxID=3069686 RepID=UPI003D195370
MTRTEILTNEIARPVGPFSVAVTTGQVLYLSGLVAQDPGSGKLIPGGITEQTEQIFKNDAAILRAARKDLSHVVKVTVLGAYLLKYNAVSANTESRLVSLQGVRMGRPSHIHIALSSRDGVLEEVQVGGEAVVVGEGKIRA